MESNYFWLAEFQEYGKKGGLAFLVIATNLRDAVDEAQRHRPSFYRPKDLSKIERQQHLRS